MWLLALFAVGRARAGDPVPPPVWNGTATDEFPPVVALGYDIGGFWSVFCSGTLVAETWVVTAAHCISAQDNLPQGAEPQVLFGGDIIHDGPARVVSWTSSAAYPGFDIDVITNVPDVGLVELAEPVTDVVPMTNEEAFIGSPKRRAG